MKLTLLGLFLVCTLLAGASPLSLEEAVQFALDSHPTIQAAQRRLENARVAARFAGAPLNPTFRLGETVGNPVDEVYNISQNFELAGQPGVRAEAAMHEVRLRNFELAMARRDIALMVGKDYLTYYLGLQRLKVYQQRQLLYENLELLSRRRHEVGDIARNQYTRVLLEQQRSQAELTGVQAEVAQLETALRAQLKLSEVVEIPDLPPPVASDYPHALDQIRQVSLPEIGRAEEAWAISRCQVQLAEKEGSPQLGLMLYRNNFVRSSHTDGFQFTLSWVPWDYGQIATGVANARGEEEARAAEVEKERRLAAQRLETNYHRWQGAILRRQQLQTQVSESLKLAQQAQKGFESGYWTLQDTLDVQRAYLDSQLLYLTAENDLALSCLELSWLCKSPAEDGKP